MATIRIGLFSTVTEMIYDLTLQFEFEREDDNDLSVSVKSEAITGPSDRFRKIVSHRNTELSS